VLLTLKGFLKEWGLDPPLDSSLKWGLDPPDDSSFISSNLEIEVDFLYGRLFLSNSVLLERLALNFLQFFSLLYSLIRI